VTLDGLAQRAVADDLPAAREGVLAGVEGLPRQQQAHHPPLAPAPELERPRGRRGHRRAFVGISPSAVSSAASASPSRGRPRAISRASRHEIVERGRGVGAKLAEPRRILEHHLSSTESPSSPLPVAATVEDAFDFEFPGG